MTRRPQRPTFWLVQMMNRADSRDDEAWKVRAVSKTTARIIAQSSGDTRRFTVGLVVPIRGGTKSERAMATDLRTYVTKTFR